MADDHRKLPPALAEGLREKSDAPGLRHLAGHLGLIVLCGVWIGTGAPLWWLVIPVQGVLICFLFTLEHECTHATPFASARLSDWVGRLCGFLILNPFLWFRYFHFAHHRFTNLPGKDPELAGPKPETRAAWTWHVSGLPYWGASLALMVRLVLGREEAPYLPPRALPRIGREARWMAVLYLLAALSLLVTPLLFWIWLLPVLLAQPALRLYLLAEHGDCPQVANMLDNTRTTFTTGIVRFLAWNMPYHTEHHVFPDVPFHQLPALHARMKEELRVTAPGYAAFTRDYLARRN